MLHLSSVLPGGSYIQEVVKDLLFPVQLRSSDLTPFSLRDRTSPSRSTSATSRQPHRLRALPRLQGCSDKGLAAIHLARHGDGPMPKARVLSVIGSGTETQRCRRRAARGYRSLLRCPGSAFSASETLRFSSLSRDFEASALLREDEDRNRETGVSALSFLAPRGISLPEI